MTRLPGAVAIGASVSLLLTGCSPVFQAYARLTSQGPEILICDESFELDTIKFTGVTADGTESYLWIASGPGIGSPATISYGSVPSGWDSLAGPAPFPHDLRAVIINHYGSSHTYNTFTVDELRDAEWQEPDGSYVTGGCSSASND